MFIELHLLQNFAPSCLNRDDTNAPKDCDFGGYRRARISSQCIKRSIRRYFREANLLPAEDLARRTKRLVDQVSDQIHKEYGKDQDTAKKLVTAALASVKLKVDDDGKTQYLLFLAEREISALAEVVGEHWDALLNVTTTPKDAGNTASDAKRKSARQQKAEAKGALPDAVVEAVKLLLNGGKAADLALFGRMLADQPNLSREAACQVAHALSTNKVNIEMDYYTAVDDLKGREEDAGADMIGTVEFNSSCFYRYANVDLAQLARNLQGDEELVYRTVEAFLRASICAIPTGKQNSMAAQNPPSLVLAVVRDRGLWSLANAFVQPVRPNGAEDLVTASIKRLDEYWDSLAKGYGVGDLRAHAVLVLEEARLEPAERRLLSALKKEQVGAFDELVGKIMEAVRAGKGAEVTP